jgi:hypothetical protein
VPTRFDTRVVGPDVVSFLQGCAGAAACHLGGGAALAGVHLRHRVSADVDLFVHDADEHEALVKALPAIAAANETPLSVLRHAPGFFRAQLTTRRGAVDVDVVLDTVKDLEPPPPPVEGVVVESLLDLRVNKLTCVLSRSEPRDLVDLLFLDRAGHPPEVDLPAALRKDAGIDPGVLAWLLGQFPVEPLPVMLVPLEVRDLVAFRDDLRERFRRLAVP